MTEEQKKQDIDYLGSAEFDITEGLKDLVWNIKEIKKDVDMIKKHLDLEDKSDE